jgi:hypothetical protein
MYSDGASVHWFRGTICIDAAALRRWCCTPPAEENNNRYRCCLKPISNRRSTDKDADAVHSTSCRLTTDIDAVLVYQLYKNDKKESTIKVLKNNRQTKMLLQYSRLATNIDADRYKIQLKKKVHKLNMRYSYKCR